MTPKGLFHWYAHMPSHWRITETDNTVNIIRTTPNTKTIREARDAAFAGQWSREFQPGRASGSCPSLTRLRGLRHCGKAVEVKKEAPAFFSILPNGVLMEKRYTLH